MSCSRRLGILVLAAASCSLPPPVEVPPLPEFRTVETAITAGAPGAAPASWGQSGYLGIHISPDADGRLLVADVAEGSPAAKAGLERGDLLVAFGGKELRDLEDLRDRIRAAAPGEVVTLTVDRRGDRMEAPVPVAPLSRPMKLGERRAVLGIILGEAAEGGGAPITRVTPGSPAEKAGLKSGDLILQVDSSPITYSMRLSDNLAEKKPGDSVTLLVVRQGKTEELKVSLGAETTPDGSGFFRGGTYWKKAVYRLAVIPIEFPDAKHNPRIAAKDWEDALFSSGTYNKSSATGQNVHGSLNDYYREQSCAALEVRGKVFDWVQVGKKRAEYSPGLGQNEKTAFIGEALEKLLGRDGADALKDFDGLFLLYAGDRVRTSRGGLYWPHRGNATLKGRRWAYFIVPEGGPKMSSISVIGHEFGHMLGLPDLYARPENPGSTGLGVWCAMSNENGGGRPQHFCAWCKVELGWLKPVVIDPRVRQRLILAPVEGSSKECFEILARPDGSEYFLLENRGKKGFDHDLPAAGLLIWRVVRSRPLLEESHGVEGPVGPRVFLHAVPFPSNSNDSFTPQTTPSSRALLGGGWPVHITQIRRLPDGRISFSVGYEYE